MIEFKKGLFSKMENKNLIDRVKEHIILYYKKNDKRIPKISNIERHFNITKKKATKIYRALVDQGFLKRNYSQYKKVEKQSILKKNKNDIIVFIIKIIMAIVGIGAVCLSVYYTGIWLDEFLPVFLAYLLSSIMIAFSVIAFETIIILWENKQFPIVSLFIVLWIIVLVFSMISTIAGQYNQRIKNVITETIVNVEITHNKLTYDIYNQEEKDVQESIKRKEKELDPFLNILSDFEEVDDIDESKRTQYVHWDTYEKIKSINKEIEKLRDELKKVREKKKIHLEEKEVIGAVEDTDVEYASFYVWLSNIFNVEVMYIEFWLSIFPAIFIDLIAPLAIAISMFLRRKKNEM